MPWITANPFLRRSFASCRQPLLFLLAALFLAGCATKPWTEPLKDTEAQSVSQLVDSLAARDTACGATLEGDLDLFYQDPLGKKALSGFLQFSMPSSYRFVMTNPFGQPLLVIAGNQKSYQVINTMESKYLAGSLRSFGLRHRIPDYFLKSSWGALLTGRNLLSSQAITEIRNDREARGVWVTLQNMEQAGVSRLLLDPEKEVYLTRLMENGDGKIVAEISYANWVSLGKCKQPLDIGVTGLDYGTEIHLKLTNVDLGRDNKTYRLQPPSGYLRQYLP